MGHRRRVLDPLSAGLNAKDSIPMTWRDSAICVDEDPELFFPVGKGWGAKAQVERAKVVCRQCDVIKSCLRWAVESGQDAGVCGGLSANERHILRRRIAEARRAD
jgi:WhiB family transcriptional regulator, redox-sensing transcriptional regulator